MEQIRVIKEMREEDRRSRRTDKEIRPRYMVWENVPGAFSSNKGKDFAAVIEEAIKIVEPEAPPGIEVPEKGWPTWGGYHDGVAGRWSLAWRVLDAQYWGVPQRRRRIALVVDFGGDTAGEILFESESLSGNSEKARSIGYQVECSPTLNAQCGGNKPAILEMTHACDVIRECGDIVPTLNARMGTGENQVPLTYAFGRSDTYTESDVASTESARQYKSATDIICGRDKSIRRLTPLECERLQGYPDGWTDIGDYIDSGGRKRRASDSARYKALGNSIAIPPWRWVLNRICSHLGDKPTMASLFDGIGGFPLIWEEICGKGTCLWASEIEEFPMAVTNKKINM